ncbi:UDP-GlcNAc:betaGal beta-1,3-N-acetylglucosaminyltransferase-like protein 1 [Araneus ventricosus]|uniref:UDP-GlcNAc:betaGal beta-1,3-N-acetylglucosaminyltransferase-like protein 1 n=1 Tax=Araneus ventricosus TaxID=182803 RepID=A0A4Y2PGJ9_ARAVE|nr:UDP-GlcNAc:betaGal beta-1,3-N-acetylglucosaminyltransferase-like protein 1 [Araneus ventricosus]GBN50209.1 UDP-GlcNAc:betaGal beta-1,3-N-acetylglucosaminyltransferase-like protein 1 [Araneus ventricosus]
MTEVSIILPLHNAESWLEECLLSIESQNFNGTLELSIFNDASSDQSASILETWLERLRNKKIKVTTSFEDGVPKGVGYAKNRAVDQSCGEYLCFLDADDCMASSRVKKQYEACLSHYNLIVGCCFHREPSDSTPRYTKWANSLAPGQLYSQIYTSFGPTLIMPTWFCHRSVYDKVGGFDEKGKGTPEDLLFFYQHLRLGGKLSRVDDDLLMYRYHPSATTFSISEDTIWQVRLSELEERVLKKWTTFTIWNAGKQGRKFYRSLNEQNRQKVQAFCDVDRKKIAKGVYIYEESKDLPKPRIPIVHFSKASPPFIICVKIDMTAGVFEQNLSSLHLVEGIDYFHFS